MQTDMTSIVFKERCVFNARAKQWQGEFRWARRVLLTVAEAEFWKLVPVRDCD